MIRLKKIVTIFFLIVIVLFIYFRSQSDNKDALNLNGINERINEIEKLIKTNRKNFELIKNVLLETQLNSNKIKELKNLKAVLSLLKSQSNLKDSQSTLKWNDKLNQMCWSVNITGSDIDVNKLYDDVDFTDIDGGVWKQGFDIVYEEKDFQNDKLFVIVVPHSHQDAGWIKSFDEYYFEDSQHILNNMLDFLTAESNMTFVYAEIIFFEKWWNSINEDRKKQVKRLLNNKQLEIVTGGWVMTDEANTHYFSILNQLSVGHEWLKRTLNYTPVNGWSIDPFGHSHVVPYILKKSGIKNTVIQRIHYIIKKNLAMRKQLEFRWKQYWDAENNYAMPCHMMPFFSYDVPHTCGPDPSICCQFDFFRMINFQCPWGKNPVTITNSNIEERAKLLLDQYRKKSRLFDNGNVVLVPLGDDFRYKNIKEWELQFNNYKKLMDYMNKRKEWNIEVKFGVLSDYFHLINKNKLASLPLLTGDLISYADRGNFYWAGYYTSRPLLKILDRILLNDLRTAEVLLSLSLIYHRKNRLSSSSGFNKTLLMNKIDVARKIFGLSQHHDAITGTAKQKVVLDYGNQLVKAINLSKEIFLKTSQSILQSNVEKNQFDSIVFDVDEIWKSYNEQSEINFVNLVHNNERYVYLFNSLPQPRQVFINIPILADIDNGIKIFGSGNQIFRCQISPVLLMKKENDLRQHFVSFKLNIGPLAFERVRLTSDHTDSENNCLLANIYYYNNPTLQAFNKKYKVLKQDQMSKYIIIENALNKIYLNSSSGLIELIEDYFSKTQYKVQVMFKQYGIKQGQESSGAYIFVPDGDGKVIIPEKLNKIIHIQGDLYDEVITETKYMTNFVRVYKLDGLLANVIDIENVVDISKEVNLELSMKIVTDFVTHTNRFYTDSNCLEFIQRKVYDKLPIQANVYPMTCGAYLESKMGDRIHKLSLFSKQSNGVRGGSSSNSENSFLEVFLDRIINQDDNRGLFESMVDNKIVRKKYRLLLEEWKQDKQMDSELGELTVSGYQILNDFIHSVHTLPVREHLTNKITTNFVGQKSLLTGFGLPCEYQMVNLKVIDNDSPKLTIHRLNLNCKANYLSEGSCKLSEKKSPFLKSMFDDLIIKYVNKLQLDGIKIDNKRILPEDVKINIMELETFEITFDS